MSPLASYKRLFDLAGPGYVLVAFLGRLPLAMSQLGTLLLVSTATGSYGLGGLAAAPVPPREKHAPRAAQPPRQGVDELEQTADAPRPAERHRPERAVHGPRAAGKEAAREKAAEQRDARGRAV